MLMPVPTAGKIIGLTHEPVGAPRHGVGNPRQNLEPAPGADIGFCSSGSGEMLNVPGAVPAHLSALD